MRKPKPLSKQPRPPEDKPLPVMEWPRWGEGIGFGKFRTRDTV